MRIMQQQKAAMMEDEATRAFAMVPSVLPSSMKLRFDDDPELYASVTQFQALAISASSSTPTIKTPTTNGSNPWEAPSPIATTTTPLPHKSKEIEPAKRAAFADLIANWHGVNTKSNKMDNNDDEQFLTSVACEQRDVGFAGIDGSRNGDDSTGNTSFGWQQDTLLDDNPWSS
ncbi:hypothetical protein BC941DRAFT_458113 [Chlamydoabsidia padenii]|nr:hypothetical protein BC941DRAFT_458113 [Chlamydoabsidia padenii]